MAVILPKPPYFVKERFFKRFQRCRPALVRIRYLIIINVWNGRRRGTSSGCSKSITPRCIA